MTAAKDLVTKMLDPDPKTRITAEQILQHPWIIEYTDNQLAIAQKLKAYNARRKLKKVQYVAYIMSLLMKKK